MSRPRRQIQSRRALSISHRPSSCRRPSRPRCRNASSASLKKSLERAPRASHLGRGRQAVQRSADPASARMTALRSTASSLKSALRISGKRLTTRVSLKRLAFSQFTQMVDHWDPMVQLHDDEIVGRFHSNSQFNVMYDSRTAPKFLGKVTTAARSFRTESSGRRQESDIFQRRRRNTRQPHPPARGAAAVRMGAEGRERPDPRVRERHPHQVFCRRQLHMAHSRFTGDADTSTSHPNIPCISLRRAARRCTCKGSSRARSSSIRRRRIVVEGNLTYAHDPRDTPDSRDYLGLVCDRYIEVAPPGVTGPGDLEIHAAIFAGRRFVVTKSNTRDRRRSGSTVVLRPEVCRRASRATPRR